MTIHAKPPPGGNRDGGSGMSISSDNSEIKPPRQNTQVKLREDRAVCEAKRLLKLEFLHECAGGIAVHAGLVQTFAEIGDMAGTLYSLKRLFAHARAAHPVYAELRDGLASNQERAP